MSKLTDKQERFCQEYIKDLNGKQAAIRAGYSENTAESQASRLLSNAKVSARATELKAAVLQECNIDAKWVLMSAKKVFDRCMQAEPVTDRDGAPIGEYKFEHSGANKSLEIIAKHVDVRAFDGDSEKDKETPEINVTFEVREPVKDVRITKGE